MIIEKFEMLVANLHDKTEYIIQSLKQVWNGQLNHGLVFKKFTEWLNLSKCLAKAIYWYELKSKKKSKK